MTKPPLKQSLQRHWTVRVFWLRRMRRRHRWLLRLLVALPLAILAILIMLAHSPLTRLVVLRALHRDLNLDVQADSVYVDFEGDLIVDRAKFRIPGVPGPAGQFLNVARIDAEVDWWSTLTGTPKVHLVRMTEPVVIVSQSVEDRTLNLERFKPPSSSGGMPAIPRIELSHAEIELGEHSAAHYQALRRVPMDGWFRPSNADPGGFTFGLHEYSLRPRRPGGPKEPGFVVSGARAKGLVSVTVENFTLDDWPAGNVPTRVRDQFRSLDLKGDVPRAIFTYAPDTGFSARLVMAGVAMNLPIEPDANFSAVAEGVQGPLPQFARMHDVNGDITFARDSIFAKVDGKLEDLAYHVNLRYDGLTPDSPFTCEFMSRDFRVDKSPSLLPYAPPRVREWLGLFCGPTALITTQMTVRRGPPVAGVPAELQVRGALTLKEGTAAYARFPYEFRDMAGTFEFDNNQVKIVDVRGKSASGATLAAHGLVTPLDETAEVTVDVQVHGAPIDAAMEDAFGPDRKQVIAALFSNQRYQDLLDADIVQTSEQALAVSDELARRNKSAAPADPDLRAELAVLERRVARPVFDFRGVADIDIHVHSPRGINTEYETTIDIRIPKAGLVPEKFPLPVIATDVTVRIDSDKGRLTGGTFNAVGGGSAKVDATFGIPARGEPDVPPEINIAATDIPFSPLLIHALPGADAESTVKRILRDLNITGLGKGTVHVAGRNGGQELGFDADFALTDAGLAPAPPEGAGPVRITGISGRILTSETKLDVSLGADESAAGRLSATIHSDFGSSKGGTPTTYNVQVACPGLDIATATETLVNPFSPAAAAQMIDLRRIYQPAGVVGVTTSVADQGAGPVVDVAITPAADLALRMFDGDMVLAGAAGHASLHSAETMSIRCDDLRGDLRFDGEPAGKARLSGLFPGPGPADPDQLHTRLQHVPVESKLVRSILSSKLSTEAYGTVQSLSPRGVLDADLTVVPDRSVPQDRGLPPPRCIALVEPRSLELLVGDVPVLFPTMDGRVEIDGSLGVIRGLSGQAANWSVSADGAWEVSPESGFTLRTQLSGKAEHLTRDLRASLPAGLRDVFEQIALKMNGPLSLDDATLALARGGDHEPDWTRFNGSLAFSGASMEVGASIADLKGRLDATFQRDGDGAPQYKLNVDADSFRIGGVALGPGRAVIQNGAVSGDVEMSEASGECYGGRYAASASVFGDGHGGHVFQMDTRLSGVRFNPLLADLSAPPQKDPPEPTEEDAQRHRDDFSRGTLDAELSIGGVVGKATTRRGRGSVRVHGGRVLNFPFATRLIEVSNLALPGNARLDFARASFYLEGGLITFDDISIYSSNVVIPGYGTMTWPGEILDLRFASRAARPVPLLSGLVQGIRDQLFVTTVTGKLGEQQVRLQQLPGPRHMLGRAVGAPESEQARRLDEIEGRADPHLPRSSAQPIPPVLPTYGQGGN